MSGGRGIADGEVVIAALDDNDKGSCMVRASCRVDQKIGRSTISVKAVVGSEHGSIFQINKRKLERISVSVSASLSSLFDYLGDDGEYEEDPLGSGLGLVGNNDGDSDGDGDDDNNKTSNSNSSSSSSSNSNGGGLEDRENKQNKRPRALIRTTQGQDSGLICDNSGYMDSNTAQRLQESDLLKMKSEGASGADIIKTLIQNSETWNSKSEFSQMKWLKKKQKKYMPCLRVFKSTPSSLCEVYHSKSKEKTHGMRPDSLGVILNQAGIHPGMRLLVFDTVLGIVTGSAAYRMRGEGEILAVYLGQQPHFTLTSSLNVSEEHGKIIHPIPSNEVIPAVKFVEKFGFLDFEDTSEGYGPEIDKAAKDKAWKPVSAADNININSNSNTSNNSDIICINGDSSSSNDNNVDNSSSSNSLNSSSAVAPTDVLVNQKTGKIKYKQANANGVAGGADDAAMPWNASGRHTKDIMRVRRLLREGAESLIIATGAHPLHILKEALPLLAPSSPFVVYCEYNEPLVECYNYMHTSELGIRLQLVETILREYQTLPGRVHPLMKGSGTGGFVLYGIYVGNAKLHTALITAKKNKEKKG